MLKHLAAAALWFLGGTFLIWAGLVAYLAGPLAQTDSSMWFLAAMIVLGLAMYGMTFFHLQLAENHL